MTDAILEGQRRIWMEKPVLRRIYEDLYARIVAACRPGLTMEVGGGSGNLKAYLRNVVSTDIVPSAWLDAAADAQSLPFADESFTNIVGFDILHHIERPRRFLGEALRVLEPGGVMVFVEPAITPVSSLFYRFAHPEPVDMSVDPLEDGPLSPDRAPFDANQAVPTLLLGKHRQHMERLFPSLHVARIERLSFFAYPLSGGFRPWSLIPHSMVPVVLRLEETLAPAIGRLMAFRLFFVLEKAPGRTLLDEDRESLSREPATRPGWQRTTTSRTAWP